MSYNIQGDKMETFLKTINFNPIIIDNIKDMNPRTISVLNDLILLKDKYDQHNIETSIFSDTVKDIESRLIKNYRNSNDINLKDSDMKWVQLVLDMKLFKIHSLRFQYFPLDYKEIERESFDAMPLSDAIKERFYEGMPLINVHIENNTDLSQAAVDRSFDMACKFFTNLFDTVEFNGFVTRTWLIYPGIVSLLNDNSNISKFAKRFEIIASNAADYQVLTRVYGTKDLDIIATLPKNTTLEKKVFDNLNKLGVSFGYMKF